MYGTVLEFRHWAVLLFTLFSFRIGKRKSYFDVEMINDVFKKNLKKFDGEYEIVLIFSASNLQHIRQPYGYDSRRQSLEPQ